MARKTIVGGGDKPSPRPSPLGRGRTAAAQPPKKRRNKADQTPRNPEAARGTATRVEVVAIERLKAAPYNPRKALKPGDPEFEKLRVSIDTFGLVDPPVWNERTGNLVGGHQRLTVWRHLHPGARELAVSVVDLSPAEEKALNVALNKIAGAWDEGKLTELLRELQLESDATVTGFDQGEIDALLAAEAGHGAGEIDTSPQLGNLQYRVVVDCQDEDHQRTLLDRFEKEKLPCRALIS